ncbi:MULTISPECIES: hypothetical protein [unclassified Pseudomonas]|uniref:hypothetical protein n=1 Tax=unclassified Pseudomonas TaxID=196821 RepID=UPI002AC9756D|nr:MULTISPECIES: hypothetical protein [unclassified Pseudomonas]MEB0048434.1 hypothetical protein [Pseudomonas sp. Dout3]MEB0098018.1 hypothetical protein [Pseudomonas sp. DC1.2]WPX57044.1 hypothetical protein RHM68_15450 [Pseudomonas sp. DC1.2]
MLIYERLSDEQREEGLNEILENAQDREAGVIRQVLDRGLEGLTPRQAWVFANNIDPLFEEGCSIKSCTRPAFVGREFCDVCEIKFG